MLRRYNKNGELGLWNEDYYEKSSKIFKKVRKKFAMNENCRTFAPAYENKP
jgi:hypothetical protein